MQYLKEITTKMLRNTAYWWKQAMGQGHTDGKGQGHTTSRQDQWWIQNFPDQGELTPTANMGQHLLFGNNCMEIKEI